MSATTSTDAPTPTAPELVVLAGVPGVGKSFVADLIAEETGGDHHEADWIRKHVVADGDPTYSGEESQRTYDELFARARASVKDGRTAVLDATFNLEVGRRTAEKMAADLGVDVRYVRVTCDEAEAKRRIRARDNNSDADVEVYEHIRDAFEPFERDHVRFDNSGTPSEAAAKVADLF